MGDVTFKQSKSYWFGKSLINANCEFMNIKLASFITLNGSN